MLGIMDKLRYNSLAHSSATRTRRSSRMGSATQVMLTTRFRATVGQKPTQHPGGQQQPWSSQSHVQRADQHGTRKMAILVMANRIIYVKMVVSLDSVYEIRTTRSCLVLPSRGTGHHPPQECAMECAICSSRQGRAATVRVSKRRNSPTRCTP
jgi:hypothetical protein